MSRRYDIAVIGAGPAGMAAAIEAAHHGASVALFDDQPSPGGQIYRAIATTGPSHDSILGPDYEAGRGLVAALAASTVERFAGATVWMVTPEREIAVTQNGESWRATASRIVLAPGAMERPFAIPGWTLPGVMTAGGAQNLLKASGLAAKGAVFAGSGPLLYLVAAQYVRAGVPPKAVIDMTPWSNRAGALLHAVGALRGWPTLWKGVGLIAEIRRARVPIIHGATQLRVEGGAFGERPVLVSERDLEDHRNRACLPASRHRAERQPGHGDRLRACLGRGPVMLAAGDRSLGGTARSKRSPSPGTAPGSVAPSRRKCRGASPPSMP